ncbi:type IV pilus modification PilV family protein [Ralstonia soli]|uniref:Type II secretion system GspH family protein n=1 Tax=Ralstonia soli TaxID=2953896 RepID=A0ABT1AJ48_9RALS|nr:type II secretion system protein [Ralstonia soli]MCO5398443.1 type II secretion system GspH family protein [Ralstonia soli]
MSTRCCPRRQRGAILIESLVALAILSLGAAAMFTAFDHLEAASHATRTLSTSARTQLSASGTR